MMVGDRLELLGREKPERRVSASAVEEDFDVLEDLGPQLGLRRPAAAVDEFLLERREEALGDGVIEAIAAAAHRLGDPAARACWPKASETNWLPWSECQISPGAGRRCASAICSASVTSSVRM